MKGTHFQARMPRVCWLVLCVTGAMFLPGANTEPGAHESVVAEANFGGLLYKLPKDGSWVRFEQEIDVSRRDAPWTGKGLVKISSVGETTENGEPCRWIEVERQLTMMPRGITLTGVFKLLIPEKHLQQNSEPLKHAVRAWQKIETGEPQKLPIPLPRRMVLGNILRSLNPGPLDDAQVLEKKVVTSKLGKLECTGLTGKVGRPDESKVYETWIHEKSPFGVVVCRMYEERLRDGKKQKSTNLLTLVEYGDGATSQLPAKE